MLKRLLLSGALVLAGALAFALAQTTPLYNLNHALMTVNLGLPSGSGITEPISALTNTGGASPVGAGGTVTNAATLNAAYLIATGAITTWAVTLPNPAYQGSKFCVANGTGSSFTSNTTVTAPAGGTQTQTLNTTYNSQSLSAGASACWVFYLGLTGSTGTWYRVQ